MANLQAKNLLSLLVKHAMTYSLKKRRAKKEKGGEKKDKAPAERMLCGLGPLGFYPGHLSEGTGLMLLGYCEEREGHQQESVLVEPESETCSISTPVSLT